MGTGKNVVNGTSSDNGTGVQIVEVRLDKNKYLTTAPKEPGNWSFWSVPIEINDTVLIEYWPGPLTTPEIRIGMILR